MASNDRTPSGAPAVKWRFPDVHPEGRKFALIAAAITLLSLFFWDFITWPLVGLTIWVAAFFRDPVRVTPQGEGLIVSPADGLVTMIERVPLPRELAGAHALGDKPLVRVSVFMSVFDVHINRTPITGTIRHVIYVSGKFLNADLDKASEENERQYFVVEDKNGLRVGFTQIAGLVARRILAFVKAGDMVVAGQRIGLIRFGSRIDVFLPEGYGAAVALGQRAIAGETVLGRKGAADVTGIAQ
ncbi:phosphatidylserine decarboxylase [Sphingomonas sp. LB-2]|uniref:phosphatidylserine decarboxylase n=1 Tax=Sphingomonas caeni TaxID=2984949 RepID=UPI002230A829|nr:phosphatidylserine decarboxylase [Sphingomonas caeni]MCW3849123.1 phosphatidylserine decarboxylase [Sphingomonas caeni]